MSDVRQFSAVELREERDSGLGFRWRWSSSCRRGRHYVRKGFCQVRGEVGDPDSDRGELLVHMNKKLIVQRAGYVIWLIKHVIMRIY